MKYDLAICYRICPKMAANAAGNFNNKLELSIFCLDSFKKSLEGLNCKIYAILDGCPEEYTELFTSRFDKESLEIIHTDSLGNKGTLKKQIDILSEQEDSHFVYFAEDDYFYVNKIEKMIDLLKSGKSDFVTPYKHPGDYSKSETIRFKDLEYLTTSSTCLTFMTTKENLVKNSRIFYIYSNWFGSDFTMWNCITLGRNFFKNFDSGQEKKFSSINIKIYGTMILFALYRFVFDKKYKLCTPTVSFATHMEKYNLAREIDWGKYFIIEKQ